MPTQAHLSKLVDDAEDREKRITILRHGKPAEREGVRLITLDTEVIERGAALCEARLP